jgi:hypothetical protein
MHEGEDQATGFTKGYCLFEERRGEERRRVGVFARVER